MGVWSTATAASTSSAMSVVSDLTLDLRRLFAKEQEEYGRSALATAAGRKFLTQPRAANCQTSLMITIAAEDVPISNSVSGITATSTLYTVWI